MYIYVYIYMCVMCYVATDLIKANIDRSLQSRTHQMCVKAQIFTDKVVLSLDGGDVLTGVCVCVCECIYMCVCMCVCV
jgi:hypothetical protein